MTTTQNRHCKRADRDIPEKLVLHATPSLLQAAMQNFSEDEEATGYLCDAR